MMMKDYVLGALYCCFWVTFTWSNDIWLFTTNNVVTCFCKSPLLKKKCQLHNLFRVLVWPVLTFWIPSFGVLLLQQFTTVSSEIRLLFVSPSSPIKNETKLPSFYITLPVVDWIYSWIKMGKYWMVFYSTLATKTKLLSWCLIVFMLIFT